MANLAKKQQATREVEVERLELLKKLRENKEEHIKQYEAAISGYKDAVLTQLEDKVQKAKEKLEKRYQESKDRISKFSQEELEDFGDYINLIDSITINLPLPRNYAEHYDLAIDMIQWDVRPNVILTGAEFQCFVRNEWDWKFDFENVSKMYTVSK